MTREEAIKRLNWVREQIDEKPIHYTHQALDMAIKALSETHDKRTETHECDYISRRAAIDALKMDISIIPFAKAREYVRAAIETIYNRLKGLPSAQKWIPVKMRPMDSEERAYWEEHAGFTLTDDIAQTFDCPMPDDGQRIWVQKKSGFVFDDVCDSDCDSIGLEGNGDWDDIVAWMPMLVPEPWKGEEDGNQS